MKVLIVDDERIIRQGLRQAVPWSQLGISRVCEAASGQEALKIVKKEAPEIIITDIQMAGMTGIDLISALRSYKDDIRVIVITGYDEFDYARDCLRLKVQEFLLKPVEEDDLIQAVREQIFQIEDKQREREEENQLRRVRGTTEQVKLENDMRSLIHNSDGAETAAVIERQFPYLTDVKKRVAVLVPSVYSQGIISGENEMLSILTIKNLLIGVIDAQRQGITFTDTDGSLLLVLSESNKSDELENSVASFIQLVQQECSVKLRVIVGNAVERFDQLRTSYNDAMYLIKEEQEKYKTFVVAKKSKGQLEMFREVYAELREKMNANIGMTEQVLRIFDTFAAASDSYNITDQYFCSSCFELASMVYFSYVVEAGENVDGWLNSLLNATLGAERREVYEITRNFIEKLLAIEDDDADELIARVKRYINEHLTEGITVSGIASYFYLSPNYFSRQFKRIAQEGCNEYIVRKRIEKARYLLMETNMKVGKIARDVGYRDTNYFSLTFKKQTGMTPLGYREMKR